MSYHASETRSWSRYLPFIFPVFIAIGAAVFARSSIPVPTPDTHAPVVTPTSTAIRIRVARSRPQQESDEVFVYNTETKELVTTSIAPDWRIPVTKEHVERRNENGPWLVTDGERWSVPLRDGRGQLYQDPLFIGKFDDTHVAVAAIQSDRRVLLRVDRSGSLHELTRLSEQTVPLSLEAGRVWLIETPPQEGIELPPHGPSTVWSVDVNGATSTRIIDDRSTALITEIVAQGDRIALGSDQGDIRVWQSGSLSQPFFGRALTWLSDGHLFISSGTNPSLCTVSPPFSESIRNIDCGPLTPENITWTQEIP